MNDEPKEMDGEDFVTKCKRIDELRKEGFDFSQACRLASLEARLAKCIDNEIPVLIYGSFSPLKHDLHFQALDIIVGCEEKHNTIVSAYGINVLEARVKLKDTTVASLSDAIRRIHILLGAVTFLEQKINAPIGWWSYVTHGSPSYGAWNFENFRLPGVIDVLYAIPSGERRQHIEAALYWLRETSGENDGSVFREHIFKAYTAYWNAFECLVAAANSPKPFQVKPDKAAMQKHLDQLVVNRSGKPTVKDIEEFYRKHVNPRLPGKANHALHVCFPKDIEKADEYFHECFRLDDEEDRLYDIRNAISHGRIDSTSPIEQFRVQARMTTLKGIVRQMLAALLPL